jgi:hypothetical protein
MIFDLLRCSTFDKLEDGILPQLTWMQNLLVGIYDREFDKLKIISSLETLHAK